MIKQHTSSPWVFLFPLVIACIVVGAVLVFATSKDPSTDIRSHASLASALSQCTSACTNPSYKSIVKDPAKCTLNCTALVNGTNTCASFCDENVSSKGNAICKQQCSTWVASAGSPQCNKLCSIDIGERTNPKIVAFQKKCAVNCTEVASGRKKCIDAFRQETTKSSFSKEAAIAYLAACKKEFAQ